MGKSELAKTLASYYFGSEDAMVRLDMSEFMERHTVSKLIGSPPGDCPVPMNVLGTSRSTSLGYTAEPVGSSLAGHGDM